MSLGIDREPVVITGAGLVTSLGLDTESTWRAMLRGACGVGPATALESALTPDPGAGQINGPPEPAGCRAGREETYLRRAVEDALRQAGVSASDLDERCGVLMGTTLHGMRHGGHFLRTGDFGLLKRFLAGGTMASIREGMGPLATASTTCSACSSGLASVSLARSLLAANELDLVIAGGYDPISEYSYAGFNSMRLVSPTTVRPFAAGRDGMKVAEGYAVVVLEREGAATSRGARTLARLMGIGESCDSFHLSKPHPEGAGAAAAIERAIADAGVDAEAVDLIIAHGTATLDNDAAEYAALKQVFGDRLAQIAMLATKSHLGHSLGAAGAVDLIVAALALRDGVVPPCANLAAEAPLVGALALTRGAAREVPIQHVLTTSLGFGGANVAAILAPPVRPPTRTQRNGPGLHSRACADQRVAISGVGVVVPGGAGNNAFLQLLKTQGSDVQTRSSTVMQEELEPLVSARRTRRMSEFAKLAVAATAEALREAGIDDPTLFCEEAAAILATMHGPTAFCESFYRQIIKEGPAAANPSLFAEGVPNVASAHLSTSFGIKGFCQTLIGSRITGLDALSLAAARIRSGEWKRAIVGAAEEHTPLVQQVYERLIPPAPGAGKLRASSCAVTLLLESEECLAARSGLPHAFVDGVVARHFPVEHPARIRRSLRHAAKYVRGADAHVCTMNGTWIDRLERMVLPADRRTAASSPYRIAGEAFAAAPLLGLAAMLLRQNAVANEAPTIWPGWQIRDGASVGIICADYFGAVSVARLSLP